jgi:large subunit ribosomal protein L30
MSEMLKVTLVKSMIGRPEKHRKVLRGMGLTKMHRTVELENTPSIRGMVNAVNHLVKGLMNYHPCPALLMPVNEKGAVRDRVTVPMGDAD